MPAFKGIAGSLVSIHPIRKSGGESEGSGHSRSTEEAEASIEGSGRRRSELGFGRRERMQQAQWAMRDSCVGTLS